MLWKRLIQVVLVLIPFGLFFWLARIELVPDGSFVVRHAMSEVSPYIDALAPQDRVHPPEKKEGVWWQAIVDDPVYFFLHPHRHFDAVSFEIWFQNNSTPIVEFGGLVQTKPEAYDLRPLHNRLIDQLGWSQISDGDLVLHQKTKQYASIQDFFAHPPARDQVAVYKADYQAPFRLPGYQPSTQELSIDASLRGRHELKTYIKNEALNVRFSYMDMNRDEGSDPVVVTLFDESGRPVADQRAEDDGDTQGHAIPSGMKEITLTAAGLPEGVYKIVFQGSRDIFIRHIQSSQNKLIFLNAIFIGDETAYQEEPRALDVWSSSQRLRMQTRHASGVQDVLAGSKIFSVSEPFEMYTFETAGTLGSMHVPKGDLEIIFDGPLSFSKEAYFQPDPVAIRPYSDLSAQGIAYILTSYHTPESKGDWLVQTLTFETSPLVFDKKSWKFTFSTPEIRARGGEVRIKEIHTTFARSPFVWKDLFSKF